MKFFLILGVFAGMMLAEPPAAVLDVLRQVSEALSANDPIDEQIGHASPGIAATDTARSAPGAAAGSCRAGTVKR